MRDKIKNRTALVFLVLFVVMKMAGLHVLSHIDDKDHALHCTVCDYAITYNLTPLITPGSQGFPIENNEYFVQGDIFKSYSFIIAGNISADQLFSRPPPFLL